LQLGKDGVYFVVRRFAPGLGVLIGVLKNGRQFFVLRSVYKLLWCCDASTVVLQREHLNQ